MALLTNANVRMKLMALALGLLAAVSAWKAAGIGGQDVLANPNNAKADGPMPNLQGQPAIAYLKQRGLYDSIKANFETDRHGNRSAVTIDPLFTEVKKLSASDSAMIDAFGGSVAISGDTVIVGSRGNNSFKGSAYIFERNRGGADLWGQVKKLTASDGEANDLFGVSVAISGDTAIVGAYIDDSFKGSAYIFERNRGGAENWGEVGKLTASDGGAGDRFGWSVAIRGDTAIVGAHGDDAFKGSAYIYERNRGGADFWGEVRKLTASDGATDDRFGISVAISGDSAIVGAHADDSNKGSAHIFDRNKGGADFWGQVTKVTASDGEPGNIFGGDRFGWSVAINRDTAIVGAFGDDSNHGSAYIFERNKGGDDLWGEVKKLVASGGSSSANFGVSVAISKDTAIVGANQEGPSSGAAYIFERNNGEANLWGEVKRLTASDGATFDQFGVSVTIGEGTAIVGANQADGGNGSAYIFVSACKSSQITCPPDLVRSNDANQCGAVVTYPNATVTDSCPGVGVPICLPASGTFFPTGTTTVTCTVSDASNNQSSCMFTVTVNDTQPPQITCPAHLTAAAVASCPVTASTVVSYPPPIASDNCPGVTAACVPPSGSILPVGTTTVTCLATDAAGNTGTCSFMLTVFDVCLQDDSDPTTKLLINSQTGQYRFLCQGTTYTGTGKVTGLGCMKALDHSPADRRVRASWDTSVKRGNASIQAPAGTTRCTIRDSSMADNDCATGQST